MTERIRLDHGEGGETSRRLVADLFASRFKPDEPLDDAAPVPGDGTLVLTTDLFVVRPPFFPGGNIGHLAVCGTVNDLAVSGAEPLALTAAFVLEEGLPLDDLEPIADAMASTAAAVGVRIVAGDTKVVGRGEADRLFICTTGLGRLPAGCARRSHAARPGDRLLVSGPVGDHGTAVLLARGDLGLAADLQSDCAPVLPLVRDLLRAAPGTRCMRDPTRGGFATAVHEIAAASRVTARLEERAVPVRTGVRRVCDLLGIDPLYVACEGRVIAVVPPGEADAALAAWRARPDGADAALVGTLETPSPHGPVLLHTAAGGTRPLSPPAGAQLPRIC